MFANHLLGGFPVKTHSHLLGTLKEKSCACNIKCLQSKRLANASAHVFGQTSVEHHMIYKGIKCRLPPPYHRNSINGGLILETIQMEHRTWSVANCKTGTDASQVCVCVCVSI